MFKVQQAELSQTVSPGETLTLSKRTRFISQMDPSYGSRGLDQIRINLHNFQRGLFPE